MRIAHEKRVKVKSGTCFTLTSPAGVRVCKHKYEKKTKKSNISHFSTKNKNHPNTDDLRFLLNVKEGRISEILCIFWHVWTRLDCLNGGRIRLGTISKTNVCRIHLYVQ